MRVTIVGAGAMGCLFGARLTEAGIPVVLVDKDPAEVDILTNRGVRIHDDRGVRDVMVTATTKPARDSADLVVVLVKTHQTRSALDTVAWAVSSEGWVLSLQNGLGATDVLANRIPRNRLLVGTTAQGATQTGPVEIRHGGAGDTVLGPVQGPLSPAAAVAALFTRANLPCRAVADPWTPVWAKLAVNCAINPITALTGTLNGPVAESDSAEKLVRDVTVEVLAVARASGIDLGSAEAVADRVLAVARATAGNRSSMGQDVDRGVATEIDFINGAVTRAGDRLAVATPVNRVLTQLVKILEKAPKPG